MPTMVREPPAGTRIDLPRFYTGDYQATFARLRATDPVHWQADTEMWIVTRHADIKTVTADTSTFSSSYGVTVGAHAIARQLWAKEGHADDSGRRWQLAELRREIGRRSSAGRISTTCSRSTHRRTPSCARSSSTPSLPVPCAHSRTECAS